MTVQDLIAKLSSFPFDAEVIGYEDEGGINAFHTVDLYSPEQLKAVGLDPKLLEGPYNFATHSWAIRKLEKPVVLISTYEHTVPAWTTGCDK